MKAPLLETLLEYHNENNLILSMPGNKCGKAFKKDKLGMEFWRRMGSLDITEVEPLDNLHCPEGVIKESQEMLAKAYKCKKAYFLVNGSSCGNLSAVFSAFSEKDEVLVERNCHKSVYNAIMLRKIKPIFIEPVIDKNIGVIYPPNLKTIEEALKKCKKPKGIILTCPNYFGISSDIKNIIKTLKNKQIITIIDAAHGAHYGFNENLPDSIAGLGDYVICSAHKTLPALTQGAYLFVNREDEMIEFYLKTFMTTSPSYLIMASLDYARYYLEEYGQNEYDKLIKLCIEYKDKINKLEKVHILKTEELCDKCFKLDETRYIMMLPTGYNGEKLLQYFRKMNIQCEMSFGNIVVMIFSTSNDNEDFETIYNAVKMLNIDEFKDGLNISYKFQIPEKKFEIYEAIDKKSIWGKIEESEGKIAKEFVIPYPPGIPILCGGEVITKEIIRNIVENLKNGIKVLGVKEGEIKIICD